MCVSSISVLVRREPAGWGHCSLGQCEARVHSPELTERSQWVWHPTCNPSSQEVETEEPWGEVAGQKQLKQ